MNLSARLTVNHLTCNIGLRLAILCHIMKLPEKLFSAKKLTFSKNKLKQLIDDLSAVDMKLANPVKSPMLSGVFGASKAFKRKREEAVKALQNKKCMIINAYVLPAEAADVMAFANLAFSCYQTADNAAVKKAWQGKLELALNKLRSLIMNDQADAVADEFLFLSQAVERVMEREERKRK